MTTTETTIQGLTPTEVADRVNRGLVNDVPDAPSRTAADIIKANVFTRFNFLLGALLVVILAVAPIQDALFGIVLVVNTAIGIIQELRAKQTLDRLALLNAPQARVLRSGSVTAMPVSDVVLDDILELVPGDQVIVDGSVVTAQNLEINEALLTGESEPVVKHPGDECRSGSFVVAGTGLMRATRVGKDAYAVALAEEARRFTLVRSELRSGIDWILAAVSWAIVPTIALLVWSQLNVSSGIREALRGAVAGAVGMVPQGLVLLMSVAFAVGVIRLGRRNVLVQELPAVEGLARVDTVCFDKTGTLTEGHLVVQDVSGIGDASGARAALGALGALGDHPNATQQAIADAFPPSGWRPVRSVPFSSERKWSAATFDVNGTLSTWVMGAPEILAPSDEEVARRAAADTERGRRVVLLGTSRQQLAETPKLPDDLRPVAVVSLGDRIRPDAADTLRYFAQQGVTAKVISGDHPATVAAIASEVGVPGASQTIDARSLPDDLDQLAAAMESTTVFGRVTPHQKRSMVAAMQRRGHVVAMTGDGVNDVLALKDADIGIAVGSGSSASRAVAQLVLMDGRFDTMPGVVGEGRRVIANIERVANLFVTKTVYAILLALIVGVVGRVFPFLPRHLTLVGSLTIGIPAFFLALEPSTRRARTGFVPRVLRFAIPTGIAAAAATFAAYELAISEGVELIEARTMATIVLAAVGLFALTIVSRPLNPLRRTLIGAMATLLLIVLLSPTWRDFFELQLPGPSLVLAAVGIVAITGSIMYGTLRLIGWGKHVPELLQDPDASWKGVVEKVATAPGDWWRNRVRFWRESSPPDGDTPSRRDREEQ